METAEENERLRAEKRLIKDQNEGIRDELERVKGKIGNYKMIIKVKESKIRELMGLQEGM